tara:strand:- start:2505 stop:3167 length:663 start_codon:yes stop_codon:yes gene_type:complete
MNLRNKSVVIYVRCSTAEQNRSGLGLDDQLETCVQFCKDNGYTIVAEYSESQSGKGTDKDRPILAEALAEAKAKGCSILVSKLCRLSRSVYYVSSLIQEGVPFIVAEMPDADAFQLHLFASFAEMERLQISLRTKAGLKQAKKRGVVLGNPRIKEAQAASRKARIASADAFAAPLLPTIQSLRKLNVTLTDIAKQLNQANVPTRRGGKWYPKTVANLLNR